MTVVIIGSGNLQRPGLSHMSKEFEEEFFFPRCEFHFASNGSLVWMRFQDIEAHSSYEGQILWRVIFSGSGIVFVENYVQRPMAVIFDTPMCPYCFHQFLGRHSLGQDHIIGGDLRISLGGL